MAGAVDQLPLAAEAAWHNANDKAKAKTIALALDIVAETIGVDVPSDGGMAVYFQLLGELPDTVILSATYKLLLDYKYKSFPNPANFLYHAEDMEMEAHQKYRMLVAVIHRWAREGNLPKEPQHEPSTP